MDHATLLQSALEMLLDGDAVEAAYAFRSFAEELEENSVAVDPQEVYTTLLSIVESY